MSKLSFESVRFSFTLSEVHSCSSMVSLLSHVHVRTPYNGFVCAPISAFPVVDRDIDAFVSHRGLVMSLISGYDHNYVSCDNSDISYWSKLMFDVCINYEESYFFINVISIVNHEFMHSFLIPFSSKGDLLQHPICLCDFLWHSKDFCQSRD